VSGPIRIVGLGPAGWDRLAGDIRQYLLDPAVTVVVRTLEHPAATELAARRTVVDCDDLYRSAPDFAAVYAGIVDRVRELATTGPVIYAVPGSPLVGETAVRTLVAGGGVAVIPGESFLDLALLRTGIDPLARGLQMLDAHDLGYPLLLHVPTLISQVDTPVSLLAVRDALLALLGAETPIVRLADLGSPDEVVETIALEDLRPEHAGLRVTLLVDVPAPGWPGLVQTNARLRRECPWDREQTHHTLARHLLEESHEALAALESLPPGAPGGEPDVAAYVEVEEELGDLLLQVVFHANLASEAGMFAIEEVAEAVRRKLVARHPHVFGEVDAETAAQVLANWDRLKTAEKGRESVLDGIPTALPALARSDSLQRRAAGAGFDWPDLSGVIAKVHEEIAEVLAEGADRTHEIGDLLFSVVNLARRLEVDPEQALRRAADRFDRRFRAVEASGAKTLEEMEGEWERAKGEE